MDFGVIGAILFIGAIFLWIVHGVEKDIKAELAKDAVSTDQACSDARAYVNDLTHAGFNSHTTFSCDTIGNITVETTIMDAMEEYRIILDAYARFSDTEKNHALVKKFFGDYLPQNKELQSLIHTLEPDSESPGNLKIPKFPIGKYPVAKYSNGDLAVVKRNIASLRPNVHVNGSGRDYFILWVTPYA